MEDLIQTSVNTMFNRIIDTTICGAIRLQIAADEEYSKQKEKEKNKMPYNYMAVHAYRDGVRAMGHILQEMFGRLLCQCIRAIEIIVEENRDKTTLGCDSQDYVEIFCLALEKS